VYHGLLLAYERWRGKQSAYQQLPRVVRIGITFLLMLFSWVLFRAEDLTATIHYFGAMFGLGRSGAASSLLAADIYTPLSLTVMVLSTLFIFQSVQAHKWARAPQTWPRVAMLVPLFVLSLIMMFTQAFNPFLYFQF
jgi:alginate O-acetyltransferase complex protein AlgI